MQKKKNVKKKREKEDQHWSPKKRKKKKAYSWLPHGSNVKHFCLKQNKGKCIQNLLKPWTEFSFKLS
jgi:hypothetical protein